MYIILHLLKLMRPHQWTKNLFVFTGLIFGHAWTDSSLLQAVILSAVAFSLMSSGVYIVNDIVDAESDRQHPKKKFRPIAAGNVAVALAASWALVLVIAAFVLAWLVSNEVIILLLAYLILNAAYSAGLKQVAVLDVFLIATGFMLRILVGTEGVGIPPSQWLLLCGLMITLFLGFTKRRAEMMVAEESGMTTRKVLSQYDAGLLDTFIAITATSAVLAYSLYTVNPETISIHGTANLIYTVPFVAYGIFRYILRLHTHRRGEDPARELLTDPHIVVTVLSWVIVVLWLIG
jgi:4-hydroxybenzoate polyprenyltransferase